VGYFYNFQKIAQSKQSPIGRKFAQSGHPGLRHSAGAALELTSSEPALTDFGIEFPAKTLSKRDKINGFPQQVKLQILQSEKQWSTSWLHRG
jgi:hypothetical protein